MSKLELEIMQEINKPFSQNGYKISDGHFEIGRKLHCETYYFVKKFFQRKENCDKMADLLLEKLNIKFDKYPKTTLVGFGNYCGLLLSLLCEKENRFNYAILENDGSSFAFQAEPDLANDIIIILPITCTCSTYFRIKKYIEKYIKDRKSERVIVNKCVSIFLIIEEELNLKLNQELQELTELDIDQNTKELYTSYGWRQINVDTIHFFGSLSSVCSLLKLKVKLYLPEICPNCFPEQSGKELDTEKFLFSTHSFYETPNLIFNLPNFNYQNNAERGFNDAMGFKENNKNPHLYGNIVINDNSYLNFVRGNIFYTNNKDAILNFFNDRLLQKLDDGDEVLFITADIKYSSFFLEDLTKAPVLQNKKVTILRYQPFNEFVDNFISTYSESFKGNTKVIYFEDVISGGRTFKLISDYIKHSKKGPGNKTGFHLLLTLIDRTSNFTKDEILRKLSSGFGNDDDFIHFFKLHVPIIGAAHLGDPLKEKYNMLKRLISECHLDALKVVVTRDIQVNRPRSLSELEVMTEDYNARLYIPLNTTNRDVYLFYHRFFTRQKLNYVKLFLTHEINSELSFPEYKEASINLIDRLFERIKNPIDEIFISEKSDDPNIDLNLRRPDFEKHVIKNIIISILSKPPFTYYEEIYKSVFNYSVKQLKLYDRVDKNSGHHKMNAKGFIQLRTLIKRSVELNSNYIISYQFLSSIKNDYLDVDINKYIQKYKSEYHALTEREGEYGKVLKTNLEYQYIQLISYNYFLLFCFKTLISRNPGKSIKLEELINSQSLLPETMPYLKSDDDSEVLKQLWRSPYYLFNRIVKAENIYLLNELKELHKEQVLSYRNRKDHGERDIYGSMPKISNLRTYYFVQKKNDIIINNARKLVNKTASSSKTGRQDIQNAVCSMLRVMNILLLEEDRKKDEEDKGRNDESKLNKEVRSILDAALEILKPGIKEGKLKYAFFIEYKESMDEDSYTLYPVFSKEDNVSDYDSFLIKLSKDGLIYKALYGLTDTIDGANPQTLLFAGKLPDGSIHSFQENYYAASGSSENGSYNNISTEYLKNPSEERLKEKALRFEELFKNDYWNEETRMGLKILDNSNMTLIFRLSNLIPPSKNDKDYRLKGQAVLVITNTAETTKENFLSFMNIEKIRLLLLIKEELLEYLQKQFDNDAFIEVLENRKQAIYQRKLQHGLTRYLEIQNKLFEEVIHERDKEKIKKARVLYDIVKKAIQGQINFKYNFQTDNWAENYKGEDLLTRMGYIFECPHLGNGEIPFTDILCTGFDTDHNIAMHPIILDVVIPEIITNMKKCSSRLKKGCLKVTYDKEENHMIFENDIRTVYLNGNNDKIYGGLDMCRNIIKKLNYKAFISELVKTQGIYITVINLNHATNASKNIDN